MKCLCGCGEDIDGSNSRGEPKLYVNNAHRQRHYRTEKEKRNVTHKITGKKPIKPYIKWPGAKWSRAAWIVSHLPSHDLYVEPYCGSAAIFLNKEPVEHEVLNDINSSVYNLFGVLRTRGDELIDLLRLTPWSREEYNASYMPCDDELEAARRFLVRCWQAHGTRLNGKTGWRHRGPSSGGSTTSLWKQMPERLQVTIARLQDAEIEKKPAIDIIREYPQACLYVDPPYELSTRHGALYEHEMDTAGHVELLTVLNQHRGPVILSGYAHPLYDEMLTGWQCVTMPSLAEKGKVRTECLWLNAKAQRRQLSLFEVEGA